MKFTEIFSCIRISAKLSWETQAQFYLQPRQTSPGTLPGTLWVFHVWEHSVSSSFSSALFPCTSVGNAVWTTGDDHNARVNSPPLHHCSHSAQAIDPFERTSTTSLSMCHTSSQQRWWTGVCCLLKSHSDVIYWCSYVFVCAATDKFTETPCSWIYLKGV